MERAQQLLRKVKGRTHTFFAAKIVTWEDKKEIVYMYCKIVSSQVDIMWKDIIKKELLNYSGSTVNPSDIIFLYQEVTKHNE